MKNKLRLLAFIFSFILIFLESYSQLSRMRMTTDFSSFALSGIAPIFEIGSPYIDYWGINPPGLLLFIFSWGLFAGTSLKSFHILYLILMFSITHFTWKVLKKTFNLYESYFIFAIFLILFFSSTVQSQFFPSELNGLFFALLGLNLTLKKKITNKNLFFATLFFLLAGQMKEVYAFTIFSLFPHLLLKIRSKRKDLYKFILVIIAGFSSGIIFISSYLLANNALSEYQNILNYKSSQFSLNDLEKIAGNTFKSLQFPVDRFILFNYQLAILLIFGLLFFLINISLNSQSKNRKGLNKFTITINFPKNTFEYSTILFFWIGSMFGYILQGRFGNKYEIAIILPMIVVISLSIKIILKTLLQFFDTKIKNTLYISITIFVLSIFLMPKPFFFIEQYNNLLSYNPRIHFHRFLNLENHESLKLETYIKENTSDSDCITAIYGWGIGSHYYYSRRPSCSKYFLINILPKSNYKEYQKELLDNPPKAIIYITENTDMNIEDFEKTAFNFTEVLKNCYQQDKDFSNLYWSKLSKDDQSTCLKIGLPNSMHQENP